MRMMSPQSLSLSSSSDENEDDEVEAAENSRELHLTQDSESPDEMRTFTFVRHGEAEHNVKTPGCMSILDPALTRKGVEQAKRLAASVQESGRTFDIVITSPLRRAMQTAMHAFGHLIDAEFIVSSLHTESGRKYRAQQGRSHSRLRAEYPTWDFSGLVTSGPDASITWTSTSGGRASGIAATAEGYMHPKPPSRRLGEFKSLLLGLDQSKRVVVVGHSGTLLRLVGHKMKNCEICEASLSFRYEPRR